MRYWILFYLLLSGTLSQAQKRTLNLDSIKLSGGNAIGFISSNTALGTSDRIIPTQKAIKTYVDQSFTNNPLRNSKGSGDSLLTKKGIDGVVKRINITGGGVTKTITDTTVSYDISASSVITGTRVVAPASVPAPFQLTGPQSGFLPSANAMIVEKFYLPYRLVVNTIGTVVAVAATGSTISLGVYDNSGNLLINSGGIASASTGLKTTTITATELLPGFYWCAYSSNSTAVKVAGFSVHGFPGLDQDTDIYGLSSNFASGGNLPSTIGTLSIYSLEGAFILLKN